MGGSLLQPDVTNVLVLCDGFRYKPDSSIVIADRNVEIHCQDVKKLDSKGKQREKDGCILEGGSNVVTLIFFDGLNSNTLLLAGLTFQNVRQHNVDVSSKWS